MWQEKFGDYLLDVSKYIFTGVVIASLFEDFDDKVILYTIGLLSSAIALIIGLYMGTLNKNKKKGE